MIAAILLFAASCAGQTPAHEVGVVPEGANFVAADDSGKRWFSPDANWLKTYVASVNAGLKRPAPVATAVVNYGVDTAQLGHSGREWFGGNVVGSVVGDSPGSRSDRIHVTVIGPGASEVVKGWKQSGDFKAIAESMGERLAVQAFNDPANPLVANVGLVAGGRPDVVIQSDDGKVLSRWKDDPGPEVISGHLRRLDPKYRAELDPEGIEAFGIRITHPIPTGIALAFLLYFLRKASKS